jgi:hypothetical protein
MREFDDNPHSYGPVLRRIGILVAVVIAVPIMLWTITSFMRTYVAQPVIASPKPLLAPTTTASIGTANAGVASGNTDSSLPAQQTASFASRTTANDSNPPSPAAKVASLATADMPAPMPAGGPPQPADAAAATQQASSPWPDPNQAVGGQQMSSPDTATAATDDALPPSAPLTGPIPLPPHRPAVIAMATPGVPGAIPLPRARPAETGAPAETTEGSGNFLTHLFGQTH